MVKRWPIALAALLLLSAFAACRAQDFDISDDSDDADADVEEVAKPFLLARKFLPGKDLVMGVNTTIAIELYNAGKSAAYDVSVVDHEWEAKYFTSSALTSTIDRIPAGGTERVEVFVVPLQVGSGVAYPARITYKAEPDSTTEQVAYSTPLGVSIITPFQLTVRKALRWGSYATLGAFTTLAHWRNAAIITALFSTAALGFYVYNSMSEAKKQQIYKKALSEVEKMK